MCDQTQDKLKYRATVNQSSNQHPVLSNVTMLLLHLPWIMSQRNNSGPGPHRRSNKFLHHFHSSYCTKKYSTSHYTEVRTKPIHELLFRLLFFFFFCILMQDTDFKKYWNFNIIGFYRHSISFNLLSKPTNYLKLALHIIVQLPSTLDQYSAG